MIRQTALMLCAFAASTAAALAQPPDEPPQIMVLGSFHFTGGGADYINPEVDDFLSPRRQADISELLDRLEAFAPTKIAVELRPQYEEEFNAAYAAYRAGEHALTVNERQQVGMALAARLGHERLYAVDYARGMDFDAMMGAASEAGQDDLLAEFQAFVGQIQAMIAEQDANDLTVVERLRFHNSASVEEGHNLYLVLSQMGSVENPAGAREMEGWWGRNMRIFANISYIAEPGDRVLVIYGSGHKALLDRFIEDAPNLQRVEAADYLR
jgi:hypothetical protein